jgi:hypothetical protein
MSSDKRVNERLLKHLKGLLADIPVEVVGHIESTFACCNDGTVALVKIDEGARARKTAKSKRKSPK